jgi:uncharacterized protein with ACT and thioredoxin-like domain
MSFICDHNKEVATSKCNILPKEIRVVHYNNYEVYMRGNKLVKQYMGTTTGTEIAKEMRVCDTCKELLAGSEPTIVGEKTVMAEYSNWPIRDEDRQNAIINDRVIVIDTLPQVKEERKPTWVDEDYIEFEDEPSSKYD